MLNMMIRACHRMTSYHGQRTFTHVTLSARYLLLTDTSGYDREKDDVFSFGRGTGTTRKHGIVRVHTDDKGSRTNPTNA